MTKAERLEIMHSLFGVAEGRICKNCSHRVCNERARSYGKCEVYGISASEATDFGAYQTACGLYNKDTDIRDIYKRNVKRQTKSEPQRETLF